MEASNMLKTKKFNLFLGLLLQMLYVTSNQADHQLIWNGEQYDKNSSLQYKIGMQAVESFNLRGDECVLDIGCGNGKITALCADRLTSGSLIAIDNSSDMIDFANKNYENHTNITFLLQDVTTMCFEQEFDFLYSIFCLHWVKDQDTALHNIAKSLKPGGKAILYIALPNAFNTLFKDTFNTIINSPSWNYYKDILSYNHFPIPKELWFDYAKQCDLEIVDFQIIQDDVTYVTCDQFKQRFTAYGVGADILHSMGEELGNRFIDYYLTIVYTALGLTADQPITRKSDGLVLVLKKPASYFC